MSEAAAPRSNPPAWRNAGFLCCLTGVLVMVAGRYVPAAPAALKWIGLAVILAGWACFAYALIARRRPSQSRTQGSAD